MDISFLLYGRRNRWQWAKKIYVLEQKSNPALLPTRVNTTNFITPSEAVVDRAVAEINRRREEPGMNRKRKHIQIISDNLS